MSEEHLKPEQAENLLDNLVSGAKPEQVEKVTAQFKAKLAQLEADKLAPRDMVDKLHVLWDLLGAPDDVVPWRGKAVVIGALSYFVSPVDLIPDMVGKLGYMDDAMIVRIAYNRLEAEREAFRNHRAGR